MEVHSGGGVGHCLHLGGESTEQMIKDFFHEKNIEVDISKLSAMKDLCSSLDILNKTETGNSLLSTIGELMKQHPNCILKFTSSSETDSQLSPPKLIEGKIEFKINMNFENIPNESYEYIVKKNERELGFVQVIHPPAVVLGHELGHVFQALSHYSSIIEKTTPEQWEDKWIELSKQEFEEKFKGVIQMVKQKIREICPDYDNETENPQDLSEKIASLITNNKNQINKGRLDNINKALSFVVTIWNGRNYDDLLNILPTKIDDNHSLSDGQLLKEVYQVGPKIKCFYVEEAIKGAIANTKVGVTEDLSQSISSKLLSEDTIPVRYGHHGFDAFKMDCYFIYQNPEVKALVDELNFKLLESFGICSEQIPTIDTIPNCKLQEQMDMEAIPIEQTNLTCWDRIKSWLKC